MPRILIVDDEEVDRELARRSLSTIDGLETVDARNGEEALALLAEGGSYDLILTDLRMPRLDGLELVKRLSAADGAAPVVLMTSKGSERIAVRALEAGAADYVPKRAMKAELRRVVERVIEIAEARRRRRVAVFCLEKRETSFLLVNDPALISPLSAWFQDGLDHLGFGNESIRAHVGIALMEAVANAMIHGNLEVSSELRRKDPGGYEKLIEERRKAKPWSDRRVRLIAREKAADLEYVVEDEGKGFDRSALPEQDSPETLLDVAGRGIYLIRTFMDEVAFNDRGNRITMRKRAPGA